MASPSSKVPPTGYPEFAVRQEIICRFFDPPMAKSTFHDFVNKGKIIPMKGIRGFYLLNASLSRLGLREVPSLPEMAATRSTSVGRVTDDQRRLDHVRQEEHRQAQLDHAANQAAVPFARWQ